MTLQIMLDLNFYQPEPAWPKIRGVGNCKSNNSWRITNSPLLGLRMIEVRTQRGIFRLVTFNAIKQEVVPISIYSKNACPTLHWIFWNVLQLVLDFSAHMQIGFCHVYM